MLNRVNQCLWLPLPEAAKEMNASLYDLVHLWLNHEAEVCVYLSMFPKDILLYVKDQGEVMHYRDSFHDAECQKGRVVEHFKGIPIYQYDVTFLRGIFRFKEDHLHFLERDVLMGKVTGDTTLTLHSHLISPAYFEMPPYEMMDDVSKDNFFLYHHGEYDCESLLPFQFNQLVMRTSEMRRLMS